MEIFYIAFQQYGIPAVAVSAITFVLTFALKIPYKLLTAKIQVESYRKLANTPIFLFPFGLGIVVWIGYLHIFKIVQPLSEYMVAGAVCGAVSVLLYGAIGGKIEAAVRQAIASKKPEVAELIATTAEELQDMQEVANVVVKTKNGVAIKDKVKQMFAKKKAEVKVEKIEEQVTVKSVDKLFDECIRKHR